MMLYEYNTRTVGRPARTSTVRRHVYVTQTCIAEVARTLTKKKEVQYVNVECKPKCEDRSPFQPTPKTSTFREHFFAPFNNDVMQ